MTNGPPDPPNQPRPAPAKPGATLYSDSSEALKAVRDDYHYWTGKLTDSSFELSVAVIAANWAVFGTVDRVLQSPWSRASIAIVVLSLLLSLLGAKIMGEAHRLRIEYAETDPSRWRGEFHATHGSDDPWPFTRGIVRLGRLLRECKTWLPITGGAAFFLALLHA